MERYNPKEIEKKWVKKWSEEETFQVDVKKAKKPFYNLMMFPYPSGEGLHVGHVYTFGGADTFGHFKKMQGYDVFEPMGFDSFGIHSENYAIKVGKHPKDLIEETTKYFREEQMKKLGTLFAWDHEVITSDPNYYKWTQWLFIQLFKAGLAERKQAAVDWCPSCKTVLADEQVIAGRCERCNTLVEERLLEQWFIKITNYSQKLLDNLKWIDWSDTTKTMQRNWIGRSEGVEIDFPIKDTEEKLKVFTTRPDTIFGATFMVIAPEHKLAEKISSAKNLEAIKSYITQSKTMAVENRAKQKSGLFTGAYCLNPLTKKEIPIWVADYVFGSYGTGAIMAVPAHDLRDFEFAKEHNLEIVTVIKPRKGEARDEAFEGEGVLINSGGFNGLSKEEGIETLSNYIEKNHLGKRVVNYHLRDWLISRQRYWGPPIPMIYCERCAKEGKSWFTNSEATLKIKNEKLRINYSESMVGWYPEKEENLPVKLPEVRDFKPLGTGVSPLASVASFVNTSCPTCGGKARRETDVSDTFLDSSWYFLRYPSTESEKVPFEPELTKKWLPVDMYIGGNEHAVLHLLYTRFVTMALHDLGYLDFEEPFKKFRANALIIYQGAKMSKSKGNVVNPNEYMDAYGSDALRIYLLFIGPFDQGGEFNDRAITGVYRFLARVWVLVNEKIDTNSFGTSYPDYLYQLNNKIANDIENLKFNTAVAALMETLNRFYKDKEILSREALQNYLQFLAPFAPFTAEELWEKLGGEGSVHNSVWPAPKETKGEAKQLIVIQINGKLKDKMEIEGNPSKEAVVRQALDREKIKSYTHNKEVTKTIWVEGRLLNIVLTEDPFVLTPKE